MHKNNRFLSDIGLIQFIYQFVKPHTSYHYGEGKAGSHGAICSIRFFCAIVTSSKKYFANQKGVLYQKSHSMIQSLL